jgi:hypothetical protein
VTCDTAGEPVGDNQFRTKPKGFAALGASQTAAPFQFGYSRQNVVFPAQLDQSLKGFDPGSLPNEHLHAARGADDIGFLGLACAHIEQA